MIWLLILKATPSVRGPFCLLGVTIWWAWCALFDILGIHLGASGAPRGGILAPRDHPGGPWEQQDGFEVVDKRILVDFGIILGLVDFIFKAHFFFRACYQVVSLSVSETKFQRLGLQIVVRAWKFLHKSTFHGNCF